MALGLLVSALSGNADKVLTILPVILFAQFVLSGSAFPVRGTPGLDEVAYLSGARWGYSAASGTAGLDGLLGDGCNGARELGTMPDGGMGMVNCDPAHAPTVSAWSQDMALLGGLTLVCLMGAGLAVRRVGQPARR
jgi:hypothetical protein